MITATLLNILVVSNPIPFILPANGYTTAVTGSADLLSKKGATRLPLSGPMCVRGFKAGDKLLLSAKARVTCYFWGRNTHTLVAAEHGIVVVRSAEAYRNCNMEDPQLKKLRQEYRIAATPANRAASMLLTPFEGESLSALYTPFILFSFVRGPVEVTARSLSDRSKTFKFVAPLKETEAVAFEHWVESNQVREVTLYAGDNLISQGTWPLCSPGEELKVRKELAMADSDIDRLRSDNSLPMKLVREAEVFRNHGIRSREALCWAQLAVISRNDPEAVATLALLVHNKAILKEVKAYIGS